MEEPCYYLCTSVKNGKVIDVTLTEGESSAHLYCVAGRRKGYLCDMVDMSNSYKRWPVNVNTEQSDTGNGRKWAKRVRCVETGEVWASVSDLQKDIGVKRWMLESRLASGTPIDGNTYEYLKEQIEP